MPSTPAIRSALQELADGDPSMCYDTMRDAVEKAPDKTIARSWAVLGLCAFASDSPFVATQALQSALNMDSSLVAGRVEGEPDGAFLPFFEAQRLMHDNRNCEAAAALWRLAIQQAKDGHVDRGARLFDIATDIDSSLRVTPRDLPDPRMRREFKYRDMGPLDRAPLPFCARK
jgi:hypothetical protein